MFIHLNKKILIPNCSRVRCIAWSYEHEFIACGGENGMLKVIKLDNANIGAKGDLSKNLSINQTLDSHKATVESVCWNEKFQKLTSSDASGTIIVWMFYKGMWYEEMVNNRQKSQVTGMAWTHDGNKICIVYEDGAIITGSVDGSRLWGKEMKTINLNQVEWSPDGRIILIGTREFEIHIFDCLGNFIKKMPLTVQNKNNKQKPKEFVCIKWYKSITRFRPLLIAFDNGQIQLMKNENDENPWFVSTDLKITSVEWNHVGEMFAVTGTFLTNGTTSKNILKIYNDKCELLSMIKVPGNEIFDCSWEKNGLKLVLAVDSYMYFANLKPRIPWCYLDSSIVFLRSSFKERNHKTLVFWEFKQNKRYEKMCNDFLQMTSWNHYCCVITKVNQASVQGTNLATNNNKIMPTLNEKNDDDGNSSYCLNLYNSVGTLIDYHMTNMDVKFCCMNSTRVIVTSNDSYYIWPTKQLHNPNNFKSSHTENLYNELNALSIIGNDSSSVIGAKQQLPVKIISNNNEQISCLTASEKYFLVAFDTGTINQYLLPNASCIHKITMDPSMMAIPMRMSLNRNSSKLALIDKQSKFYIYDFEANNEDNGWTDGKWIDNIKLNDIWDFKWQTDNNDLIVLSEKNKLIVINLHKTPKIFEPIIFNGYICRFEQLTVKTLLLDQLIVDMNDHNKTTSTVNIHDYIENVDSQLVKNIKDIIEKESMTDAINYALRMPELPTIWNIISQESLNILDVDTAYLAMVKSKDYKGLQFIKSLNKLQDDNLKRAEVLAYNNQIDAAEKMYLQFDRPDLALHLNKVVGNFERVLELLQKYNLPNREKEMENVHLNLGEYYADNYDWIRAMEHYEKINAYDKLVEYYINQEKYDALISLIDKLNDDKTLLQIAMFLESLGFCKDSVRAYVKANHFENAINVCINLSEWKMATELANQYKTKNIGILLERYIQHLQSDHKYIEMIETYRKANQIDEAVNIIMKLIDKTKNDKSAHNGNLLKKLYVLIGIIYEENKKETEHKTDSLNELLSQNELFSSSNPLQSKTVEDPWKGAEAYHYLLMAQSYLYRNEYDLAMKTALHLQNYEEYLTYEQIYSTIALAAYANKCYDICSKAFIKLESLGNEQKWDLFISDLFNVNDDNHKENISDHKRNQYEQLAVQIFIKNPPNEQLNNVTVNVNCKYCSQSIPSYSITCSKCHTKFPACVASGKSIMDPRKNWSCKRCGHPAIQDHIESYKNCPLCHFPI